MAGILAASATKTMASGNTSANGSVSGYIVGEQVTLTTTPTGTNYAWAISIPSGSAAARSALSASTGASVTFTPDYGGLFVISCTVDSTTTYTLVISVAATVASTAVEAIRYQALSDATVSTPVANAVAVYVSTTTYGLVQKDTNGQIVPLLAGTVGAALTDADATINVGDGVNRVVPPATLTANHTITLGVSGVLPAHILKVFRLDTSAHTLTFVDGGTSALTLLTLPASEAHMVEFYYDSIGTSWLLAKRKKLV